MKRIYKVNENYFEKIDTPEKAYVLGFFYADGYNNQKIGVLEFVQIKERLDILEQIREQLLCNYNIKEYTSGKYTLNICSKKMSSDIANAGAVQNKSDLLEFPSEQIISKELIPHFIRGYFDGDGCI